MVSNDEQPDPPPLGPEQDLGLEQDLGPEQDSDSTPSPHDRLISQALQQIDAARALFASHLPAEIVKHLKLDTLAPADTSFVDRNLKRRFPDRLFSVEVSDDVVRSLSMRTNFIYVYILIDHKSTAERETLIQMLGYIVRIWENAISNNLPLVPIIPWVIYNGVRPWRTARSLSELIPVPESWRRFVPELELQILDICRMEDQKMTGHPVLQMALTLLKYGRESRLEVVLHSLFQVLAQSMSGQEARDVLDTVRSYVISVNPSIGEEKMDEIATKFWPVKPEPGSVADQLIKKGEKQGEARGETRGEARASANTIRMLQAILGVTESTDDELAGKDLDELKQIIESLRVQVVHRPN